MFLALRGLPVLLEIGLLIFCLIEAIQTPADEIRGLSKTYWILLILFFPIIGGVAWLVAGRPVRPRNQPNWRMGSGFPEYGRTMRPAPTGPDDDPEFLREMRSVNSEQEETLRRWEEDLRRREAEQRRAAEQPRREPDSQE
jgi:hypothetical protein